MPTDLRDRPERRAFQRVGRLERIARKRKIRDNFRRRWRDNGTKPMMALGADQALSLQDGSDSQISENRVARVQTDRHQAIYGEDDH